MKTIEEQNEVKCLIRDKTITERVHEMIHEISFAIENGEIDKAKKLLCEADVLTHNI